MGILINLYYLLVLSIVYWPITIWVFSVVLFFVFWWRHSVLQTVQKESFILAYLILCVSSVPVFYYLYQEEKFNSKKARIEFETFGVERVFHGIKIPAESSIYYKYNKEGFKDEDLKEIRFASDFVWGDLEIDGIVFGNHLYVKYFNGLEENYGENFIHVNVINDSVVDGWWCAKGYVDFRRKEGGGFNLSRDNYALASCKLDEKIKLKFGDFEGEQGFYFDPVIYKRKDDSFEKLMNEVVQKSGRKDVGKYLTRMRGGAYFTMEIEQDAFGVSNWNSVIDSNKNILFFDAEMHSYYNDFIRIGNCSYRQYQSVVLSPSREKNLLDIVFLGDGIENRCRKHTLPYKFKK